MVIGVTGVAGSGKTTISQYLKDKYDFKYINVDEIVKKYIESDKIENLKNYLNTTFGLKIETKQDIIESYFEYGMLAYLQDINFKRDIDNEIIMQLMNYKEDEVIVIDWLFLPKSSLIDKCDVIIKTKIDYNQAKERYIKREKNINIKKYTLVNESAIIDDEICDLVIDTTQSWKKQLETFVDNVLFGKEKVSIIVPVYNVEQYLVKCITSILNQTYKNIEVILVDDGSKDSSPVICDMFMQRDDRIKVIHQENKGLSGARNTGLINATGTYIGFVDSDDYIEKNMIEDLLTNALNNNAEVSCGRANIYSRDGKLVNFENADRIVEIIDDDKLIENYLNGKITIASWDKLYKKTAIEGMLFDTTLFNEDADYTLRLCLANKRFVCTNKQYYNYIKRNSGSITGTKFNSRCFITQEWGKRAYNDILDLGKEYKAEAELCLFNSLAHVLKLYKRDHIIGDKSYQKEIQSVANDIMELLLNTQYINQFVDLDNILGIINDLLDEGILDKDKMPYIDLNCVGVLWNSLEGGMMKEAIQMINDSAIITKLQMIDLQEKYKDFIYDIYLYNNEKVGIPVFKSSVLIDKYDKNDIVILNLIVRVSSYIFYNQKKGYIYKEVSELKEYIRSYFKDKIREYAYDNIFHLTVDDEEYAYTKQICKKYIETNEGQKYET